MVAKILVSYYAKIVRSIWDWERCLHVSEGDTVNTEQTVVLSSVRPPAMQLQRNAGRAVWPTTRCFVCSFSCFPAVQDFLR